MRFTRVRIDNFYNLKDVDLDLTERHALIVGPNGSGKSNIIKCIDFLVDGIIEDRFSLGGNISNVDAPKAKIEVEAVFDKEEVEFFSNLSMFYLLCDLCEIISFICEIVKSLVFQHFKPQSKHPRPEQLVDELGQMDRFREFPKETLRFLFESGFLGTIQPETGKFEADFGIHGRRKHGLPIEALTRETIEKLFPELLKSTQKALAAEMSRSADDYDVFMFVHTADTGNWNDLEFSHHIVSNEWSPTSPQAESEVIWNVLKTIFGELNGIEVTLTSALHQNVKEEEKCTSLERLISSLVKYWRFYIPTIIHGEQIEIQTQCDSARAGLKKHYRRYQTSWPGSPVVCRDTVKWKGFLIHSE